MRRAEWLRLIVGGDELTVLSCATRVEVERATGPLVHRRDWERHAWRWRHWEVWEVLRWQRLRVPVTHPDEG
jgi:hypothetical protein